MKPRTLSITAGVSYLIIFFAAIFANFSVLESISKDPLVAIPSIIGEMSLSIWLLVKGGKE